MYVCAHTYIFVGFSCSCLLLQTCVPSFEGEGSQGRVALICEEAVGGMHMHTYMLYMHTYIVHECAPVMRVAI